MGAIVAVPGVPTPPTPLSISTPSALVTAPQLRVLVEPSVMEFGEAEKEAIVGEPEQADAVALDDDEEDDVEMDDDELDAVPTTLILTVMA